MKSRYKYILCSGKVGTSSFMAKMFLPWQKNIVYGGRIFRENASFSSEKRFQMLSFQKTFHYFKYRHTYGKKYGIWQKVIWQKIVFEHHSQMGKKLSLLFDFKFWIGRVIFSPRCILWQIINITKGTKNINAKKFFDPPACRVGGRSTAVPSYVESRKYFIR